VHARRLDGRHGEAAAALGAQPGLRQVQPRRLHQALELQGYAVGAPLAPQAPLAPEGVEEVRRALAAIGALP